MSKKIESLLVIGTGTMGAGIAQVAAAAGCEVSLYDTALDAAENARARIAASLARAKEKGYVEAADMEDTLARLHPVGTLKSSREAGAVIEAVREDLQVKQEVFLQLENIVPPDTLLWTNTSMISITRIADPLRHPERVAGTHFFNPVPRMKLVEIIGGRRTDARTLEAAESAVRAWGKTPVRAPDTPGFIVNRLLDALLREALSLHEEGVEGRAIDEAVRLGLNFPMGPLELMDLVGLDTTRDCLVAQADGMGRELKCGESLLRLVKDGRLGRKSGRGFFDYPPQ